MGYSLFKTVIRPEAVGNRLKEVQESVQDLSRFGKMVSLVSFLPFEYVHMSHNIHTLTYAEMASKHLKSFTISPRVSHPNTYDLSSS